MSPPASPIKDPEIPDFYVLIAAAGQGTRYAGETPKQYEKIHGKSVLRHSIDAFIGIPGLREIQVIIGAQDADLYHDALKGLNLPPPVMGDKERNLSIYNGLKSLSHLKHEDIVLIHDAARPCIARSEIIALLKAMNTARAASLAVPQTSTLRRAHTDETAADIVNRENLWVMQTPQAFRYGDILKAHENGKKQSYSDDTTLLSEAGIKVQLVRGAESNIKITYKQDLQMAAKLLQNATQTRIGMGFDVHAFDTESKGPVRLCGIDIKHDYKLKGHSDADVGLHSLTDAILGAVGAGDIGQHFPPSNPEFKNMDSTEFLKRALDLLMQAQGNLNNIDLTIICEEPKIGPHNEAIKRRLAEITNLPLNAINIKATTTEGLGFTGRKEGIAAQAIVSVNLPQD